MVERVRCAGDAGNGRRVRASVRASKVVPGGACSRESRGSLALRLGFLSGPRPQALVRHPRRTSRSAVTATALAELVHRRGLERASEALIR
jgi:hypothetical protein